VPIMAVVLTKNGADTWRWRCLRIGD